MDCFVVGEYHFIFSNHLLLFCLDQWFSTFFHTWPIFITQIICGPLAYLLHKVQHFKAENVFFAEYVFLAKYLFEICINAKLAAEICPPVLQLLETSKREHIAYCLQHRDGYKLLS